MAYYENKVPMYNKEPSYKSAVATGILFGALVGGLLGALAASKKDASSLENKVQ